MDWPYVALLLGAAGVAIGGWGVWQVRHLQTNTEQQSGQVQALNDQAQSLKLSEQRLSERLAQLPGADELADRQRLVAQLQGDQQRLSQRLETVLGASRKDWRLAEAEHLLRLASLRLSALQDISSAQALVQGADEILREQNDPGSFAAREQVGENPRRIAQHRAAGSHRVVPASGCACVIRSSALPNWRRSTRIVASRLLGLTADGDGASRWAQWWDQVSRYFRIDFNADKNVRPLLAGQGLSQVRLALSLALEQAQWAALNGQARFIPRRYRGAGRVDRQLQPGQSAKQSDARAGCRAEQGTGHGNTPDLTGTLSAVQAYLERRNVNAEESVKPFAKPAANTAQEATP